MAEEDGESVGSRDTDVAGTIARFAGIREGILGLPSRGDRVSAHHYDAVFDIVLRSLELDNIWLEVAEAWLQLSEFVKVQDLRGFVRI